MHVKGHYVIITHRSGKQKVIPIDTYNRHQRFKRVVGVLAVVLSMLFLTSATATEGNPDNAISTVVLLALCSSLLIVGIVFGISGTDSEDGER